MKFRVKDMSDISGVSIRTLHHYEEIGLLKPDRINEAGYREYSEDDLARLQEILFFRELDFGLAEIKGLIESPGYRRDEALAAQKHLLALKIERLNRIIKTIDKTAKAEHGGKKMKIENLFDGLDAETQEEYTREAKERWGETDAYRESARKTAKYTKDDWDRIGAESADIYSKTADLMGSGLAPEHPDVQAQVQRWRDYITKNFYNCPPEMVRGLGEIYVADERFTKNIDKVRPGLAAFLSKAMAYYADNARA
jgi:DNA-binding transcriptional MerR regulator